MLSPTKLIMNKFKLTVVTCDNFSSMIKLYTLMLNLLKFIPPEDLRLGPTRKFRKKKFFHKLRNTGSKDVKDDIGKHVRCM